MGRHTERASAALGDNGQYISMLIAPNCVSGRYIEAESSEGSVICKYRKLAHAQAGRQGPFIFGKMSPLAGAHFINADDPLVRIDEANPVRFRPRRRDFLCADFQALKPIWQIASQFAPPFHDNRAACRRSKSARTFFTSSGVGGTC